MSGLGLASYIHLHRFALSGGGVAWEYVLSKIHTLLHNNSLISFFTKPSGHKWSVVEKWQYSSSSIIMNVHRNKAVNTFNCKETRIPSELIVEALFIPTWMLHCCNHKNIRWGPYRGVLTDDTRQKGPSFLHAQDHSDVPVMLQAMVKEYHA